MRFNSVYKISSTRVVKRSRRGREGHNIDRGYHYFCFTLAFQVVESRSGKTEAFVSSRFRSRDTRVDCSHLRVKLCGRRVQVESDQVESEPTLDIDEKRRRRTYPLSRRSPSQQYETSKCLRRRERLQTTGKMSCANTNQLLTSLMIYSTIVYEFNIRNY